MPELPPVAPPPEPTLNKPPPPVRGLPQPSIYGGYRFASPFPARSVLRPSASGEPSLAKSLSEVGERISVLETERARMHWELGRLDYEYTVARARARRRLPNLEGNETRARVLADPKAARGLTPRPEFWPHRADVRAEIDVQMAARCEAATARFAKQAREIAAAERFDRLLEDRKQAHADSVLANMRFYEDLVQQGGPELYLCKNSPPQPDAVAQGSAHSPLKAQMEAQRTRRYFAAKRISTGQLEEARIRRLATPHRMARLDPRLQPRRAASSLDASRSAPSLFSRSPW